MKVAVSFIFAWIMAVSLMLVAVHSRAKLELVEIRNLPLPAPQSDTATRSALESAWALVKDNGYTADTKKISSKSLSADEYAERDFPLQAMLLRDGYGNGADVNVLYIGAEKLDENGIPSEVFFYGEGLRRSWFDTRYSIHTVTVSDDGRQITVTSHPTILGEFLWYLMIGFGWFVSVIAGAIAGISLVEIVTGWCNGLRTLVYRLRS